MREELYNVYRCQENKNTIQVRNFGKIFEIRYKFKYEEELYVYSLYKCTICLYVSITEYILSTNDFCAYERRNLRRRWKET